jgi:nitrite reductase/ring-hydroxylating ferredoxin subunit
VPLVLLRRGNEVLALHGVCSHWGASLADGRLVMGGEAVECPWHHSTFSLRDGTVLHGPAATPQPHFDARVRDGNIEVRRAG